MTSKLVLLLVFLLSFSLLAGEAVKDDPQAVCRASVDAAKKMLSLGQVEPAKTLLDVALRALPNDPEALLARARIRLNEGDLSGASQDAETFKKVLFTKGSSNWTRTESQMFDEAGTICDRSDLIGKARKDIEKIKTDLKKAANDSPDENWRKKLLAFTESITYLKEDLEPKTTPPKEIKTPTKEVPKAVPIDPIIGKWQWPRSIVTFFSNGEVESRDGAGNVWKATWKKTKDSYLIKWYVGTREIFTLTIEDDIMKWQGYQASRIKE